MPDHSRLARLLQFVCFLQLGLALAWIAWSWSSSPAGAVAGALLVLGIAPVVLGVELLIVSQVARSDPATPRPTATQLLRAWVSESIQWYRVFCWRQPFRWRAESDALDAGAQGRQGIVFVHGFMCNRGFWNEWMRRCRSLGHPCIAVNLEPVYGSIDDYAAIIDAAMDRMHAATGHAPVLVCHSMGGLAARAWWRAHGADRQVAHVVTIGTPHRGTWLARFSRRPNGRQMQLQCAWLQDLVAHERVRETPPITCWYSNCDNVVFPASTATLPQADNRFVPGQSHVALAFDPVVVGGTFEIVAAAQRRQGESVTETPIEIG
ncbi:MAG: alpha/beta fold hydrolase [Comamonadaceae bacterium]|nr:MAG: alpha/beta fold hydrolase [Comamonadaceae bacterium]